MKCPLGLALWVTLCTIFFVHISVLVLEIIRLLFSECPRTRRIRPLHVPVPWRTSEHRFDRLQRTIFGLRIEQVDDGDPQEIQSSKEEIRPAL